MSTRIKKYIERAMGQQMDSAINKHIDLLGAPAKCKVTGLAGVVTSISFDLYGCIQAIVTPAIVDGTSMDGRWLDVGRLVITGDKVMDAPDFHSGYIADGKKGAAEKPAL